MTDASLPAPSSPAEPPPPPTAGRASWWRRVPWGTLLVEGGFTVIAILLALAADDWRQRRENRELAATALDEFRRELAVNQRQLARVRPYHDSLRVALQHALQHALGADGSQRIRTPTDAFPQFKGTRPAFLVSAAWETAVATGALRHIEPRVVRALSTVYTLQADLDVLNRSMYGNLLSGDVIGADDFTLGARIIVLYLGDVRTLERELAESYEAILRGSGAPTPDSAARPAPAAGGAPSTPADG